MCVCVCVHTHTYMYAHAKSEQNPDLFLDYCNFLKDFIYLFLERGEGREREGGRETSMCGCFLHTPYWGPGQQPRHVP